MTVSPTMAAPISKRKTDFSRVLHQPLLGPLAALILAVIVFSVLSSRFLTPFNVSLILQQSIVVGILAVGQTLIILTAGIDLSIGATAVLGTIMLAKTVGTSGPVVALAATLLICMAVGAINGALVTVFKLPPFIVTLGTFTAVAAATQLFAGSTTYPAQPGVLSFLGTPIRAGGFNITVGVIALILVYAVTWYALTQTAGGKHIYAVGGSPTAARLAGIKTSRTLFSAYLLTGVIAAIAAWAALGRIPTADPNAFQTANLDTITAVVIGGTSLFGGRGSVLGTLIGTLIVGVLRNGLTLIGVDNLYQNIATGVLVIVAVAFDQFARRRTS
jgi:fructose transport system permease protein